MRILITGAASGIGRACAAHYAAHDLIAIDKGDVDLSDPSAVNEFITTLSDVDVMIYCAGIREIELPHRLSLALWQQVLHVNLTASFLLSQALIQQALMTKKALSIVNIASVSGLQAEPDRAAYVASKFALIGLSKQLAYQYGKDGVRVNVIAPGIIETPLTQSYFVDEANAKNIKAQIPVGYWGDVSHVISLIDVCLRNDYMNGAVLVCDGGWTIGRTI